MINNLDQPSFWISVWVELRQSDHEGLLNNVPGVLLVQSVFPSGAADERQKELQIELVETRGVDRPEFGGREGRSPFPFSTHELDEPMDILSRERNLPWSGSP